MPAAHDGLIPAGTGLDSGLNCHRSPPFVGPHPPAGTVGQRFRATVGFSDKSHLRPAGHAAVLEYSTDPAEDDQTWTRLDEVLLPVKKAGSAMVDELPAEVTALRLSFEPYSCLSLIHI